VPESTDAPTVSVVVETLPPAPARGAVELPATATGTPATAPATAPGGAPAPTPQPAAGAANTSITIQALWQVQQGCIRYCTGTSLLQAAVQTATTIQIATVPAPGGGAGNRSTILQVVVQVQFGCIEFCFGTSEVQSATQRAQTVQVALQTAGGTSPAAANAAVTAQIVWQLQHGCLLECHGTSSAQTGASGQASTASPPATPAALGEWLASFAAGATIEIIEQYEEASCLERCTGDTQVQLGVQEDVTVQVAASASGTSAPDRRSSQRRGPRARRGCVLNHQRGRRGVQSSGDENRKLVTGGMPCDT
jgi:hypothetical protein